MLVTEIERNRPTEPEKQVQRVVSTSGPMNIAPHEEFSGYMNPPRRRRGVVLRSGSRRQRERREGEGRASAPPQRRAAGDRRQRTRFNPRTHEVLVVAVEKGAGQPDLQPGDEVVVEPGWRRKLWNAPPPAEAQRAAPEAGSETEDEDRDYVLHLSTTYSPPQ